MSIATEKTGMAGGFHVAPPKPACTVPVAMAH